MIIKSKRLIIASKLVSFSFMFDMLISTPISTQKTKNNNNSFKSSIGVLAFIPKENEHNNYLKAL